ncbi:MAG: Uncharacterized protein Athens101428_66 [Candidatus Berkelbacteria bacterium Athens1014_28]|uniref:Uncharacterized protein n=1 Tax=Candidatus Berkelbacteria bacterium Athens1014_28 TaxID=2017145 RepID=A0A554LPY3_9BACT|nr:MAG: Uncharacterized protein Athens101428_66 [Candidatus Berkelbacteria bacterium Athens1014_28]
MSGFWKVFITAFVSTIIVGGVTFYFMNQKLTADNKDKDAKITDLTKQVADLKATSTTSVSTTTPATTDATADWKTYTSTKYGYSFKYPNNTAISSVSTEDTTVLNSGGTDGHWLIQFSGEVSSMTLESYKNDQVSGKIFGEATQILINGITAYEGVDQGMVNNYAMIVGNGSGFVKIVFDTGNVDGLAKNKAALTTIQKQILSTFQFTK